MLHIVRRTYVLTHVVAITIVANGWAASAATQATTQAATNEMQDITKQLTSTPPRNLHRAQEVFREWCKAEPESKALEACRLRFDAVESLKNQITSQLQPAAQKAMTDLLGDFADNNHSAKPSTPAKSSYTMIPAEQLYVSYLPYFTEPIDASALKGTQKEFLRAYYDAEVRSTSFEIIRAGQALVLAKEGGQQLESYLLILPLLHGLQKFDPSLLAELPGQMLTSERLGRLSDFCLLQVGRPDAAVGILHLLMQVTGARFNEYDSYLAVSEKCMKVNRSDLAVKCLRAAIGLLQPDDPKVLQLRFRMCDYWASTNNSALAAGEAGAIMKRYKKTKDAGKAFYLRIKYLTNQGDSASILNEVDDAISDEFCKPFKPELLYLKWKALRKEGKGELASSTLKRFLKDYPENMAASEMYFAVALDCLSAQRYDEARDILDVLVKKFPSSNMTSKAQGLLSKLKDIAEGKPPALPNNTTGPRSTTSQHKLSSDQNKKTKSKPGR